MRFVEDNSRGSNAWSHGHHHHHHKKTKKSKDDDDNDSHDDLISKSSDGEDKPKSSEGQVIDEAPNGSSKEGAKHESSLRKVIYGFHIPNDYCLRWLYAAIIYCTLSMVIAYYYY